MLNRLFPCALVGAACLFASPSSAQIRIGGPNLKTANVHVDRGNIMKGQSSFAVAAFRVIFVTSDYTSATSSNNNAGETGAFYEGRSKASAAAQLVGLDKDLMQKLTDEIYADFLTRARTAGYTVVDSKGLAQRSKTYTTLPMTENFGEGRFGTYVIPTGQTSTEQANDNSTAVGRGASSGVFGGFKKASQSRKKSDADKQMPDVSTEAGMPVVGVTMVVSFARFKSNGFSHWGQSSKTSVEFGPTINGIDEEDMPMATGIQFWDKDSNKNCVSCYKLAAAVLRSDIHTTDSLGSLGKPVTKKDANWITGNASKDLKAVLFVDPELFQKNELAQASRANEMLIGALARER